MALSAEAAAGDQLLRHPASQWHWYVVNSDVGAQAQAPGQVAGRWPAVLPITRSPHGLRRTGARTRPALSYEFARVRGKFPPSVPTTPGVVPETGGFIELSVRIRHRSPAHGPRSDARTCGLGRPVPIDVTTVDAPDSARISMGPPIGHRRDVVPLSDDSRGSTHGTQDGRLPPFRE